MIKLVYKSLILLLFIDVILFSSKLLAFEPVDLSTFEDGTLGKYAQYFQEQSDQPLSIDEAIDIFNQNTNSHFNIKQGSSNSISLGIGVRPVWLKVEVNNPIKKEQLYRLSVETPWLDYIDSWLIREGRIQSLFSGGDGVAFNDRPMPHRFYAFETGYLTGKTNIFIRVESLGPMAIPVRFSSVKSAASRDVASAFQYGVLYGIMLALALYNMILFLMVRRKEYGLYSLYLFGFVANSLSYTGYIHTIITGYYGAYFQDWSDAFLMITYSVAGLHFARFLLKTKEYAPMLNRITVLIATVIPVGMLFGALFNNLYLTLILAFILNSSFAILFVVMGVSAIKANVALAKLFLFSSLTAAICIGISTMAVGGLVPYNDFTFKAIEVGMAFEAITLALILAQRFRMAQRDKLLAENFAQIDPLTKLYNRRGFLEITNKIWQNIIRNKRDISIIMFDIDNFKSINDSYGHATGDLVLTEISKSIRATIRTGDVSSRWGGEEFILLLPETTQEEAYIQAERVRKAIEVLTIIDRNCQLHVTVSLGVTGTSKGVYFSKNLDDVNAELLINKADEAMYNAKSNGKNQTSMTVEKSSNHQVKLDTNNI